MTETKPQPHRAFQWNSLNEHELKDFLKVPYQSRCKDGCLYLQVGLENLILEKDDYLIVIGSTQYTVMSPDIFNKVYVGDIVFPKDFVKRPTTVSAIQYTEENLPAVMSFLGEYGRYIVAHKRLLVVTLEDHTLASVGDWIIRGTHGEFYPCKDEIFKANYDEKVLQK